jgi:hypothetical protein
MGFLFLLALAVGGYYFWTSSGGEVSGTAPNVERPQVDLPDPNTVGDKATDYGNTAADAIMGLTPGTWKIILIALGATYLAWLWFTRPKFKWAVIGGALMLLIIIGVVPQM